MHINEERAAKLKIVENDELYTSSLDWRAMPSLAIRLSENSSTEMKRLNDKVAERVEEFTTIIQHCTGPSSKCIFSRHSWITSKWNYLFRTCPDIQLSFNRWRILSKLFFFLCYSRVMHQMILNVIYSLYLVVLEDSVYLYLLHLRSTVQRFCMYNSSTCQIDHLTEWHFTT